MSDDVVPELDAWLAHDDGRNIVTAPNMATHRSFLTRVRDELVQLRQITDGLVFPDPAIVRVEALEEAAKACERVRASGQASWMVERQPVLACIACTDGHPRAEEGER